MKIAVPYKNSQAFQNFVTPHSCSKRHIPKPNRHLKTHAVPYATSGSFLRTPSAVVSYKIRPANLARTSQLCVPSELFHLPSSASFNTSCPAQTSGNQYPSAGASS